MKKLLLSCLAAGLLLCGCSKDTGDKATTAQNGDVIVIDYVGKVDGVAFDNGSAQNQALFLGAGGYIEGFEEGMIGMSAGETKVIDVTFPKEYAEELAGKDATFDITMQDILKAADKDHAAKNGDVVTIDFVGKQNGVAFEGGTAQGQSLFLGSGQYIPGFEEGIEGMKINETKTIEVTFPEDYGNELAGKAATFDITLKGVYTSIK